MKITRTTFDVNSFDGFRIDESTWTYKPVRGQVGNWAELGENGTILRRASEKKIDRMPQTADEAKARFRDEWQRKHAEATRMLALVDGAPLVDVLS